MKRILMLGAGRVSRPMARYLLDQPDCRLTVASLEHNDARSLIGDHPRGRAVEVDVTRPDDLGPLVEDADLVISLVPFVHHVAVARLAVHHGVSVITTSYVSPEMRALDGDARDAGVLLLNETGLDPGIDHMSAMRVIHGVRAAGGRVSGFWSACGGLPAPESADNAWRYKFSWSPRGALLAGLRPAHFLRGGREIRVPHEVLFDHPEPRQIERVGELEVYPNGDALRYLEAYGLSGMRDMFRGTLRYPGWCAAMREIVDLGMLDLKERVWPPGTTYAEFLAGFLPARRGRVDERLARHLGVDTDHDIVRRFAEVGLFSDEPLDVDRASPLDVLAGRFERSLKYAPGERDMVVLEHRFAVERPGAPGESIRSLLVTYGEPGGDTATARTVSLPAAIAARLVLDGRIDLTGVHVPVEPRLYGPILDELAGLGIAFVETRG